MANKGARISETGKVTWSRELREEALKASLDVVPTSSASNTAIEEGADVEALRAVTAYADTIGKLAAGSVENLEALHTVIVSVARASFAEGFRQAMAQKTEGEQ